MATKKAGEGEKILSSHITAAEAQMRRRIKDYQDEYEEKHPQPTWEQNRTWERAHPSPREKHSQAIARIAEPFFEKMEDILFDAKMGRLTEKELYDKVKSF